MRISWKDVVKTNQLPKIYFRSKNNLQFFFWKKEQKHKTTSIFRSKVFKPEIAELRELHE